jgi:secondary thiamine-phosphate synthase enzyme
VKQRSHRLTISTHGPGFTDLTEEIRGFAAEAKIESGLVTVFIPHTSASLLIQENADPDVLRDLKDAYARLAPKKAKYRHDAEGPDDMPGHIRAALSQTSLSIPVEKGALVLGVWQAVYLFEHRDASHNREIALHLIGV